uniref:Spermatogenesis associated 22 n=1 Tax=Amphilophus citrinellus TaxID=61819 RepID=A0A3Q0SI06_AMPCI
MYTSGPVWIRENPKINSNLGSFSVPLFNQKKRNRVPLTSVPSENEFFSHSEYMASTSSASGPSSGVPQSQEWNRQSNSKSAPAQQYGSSRPAPGPAPPIRAYGHLPHPYKAGGRRCLILIIGYTQETFSVKPAVENSLRILTAVIDGMRHWSQFKDRVPYLFEIFATLDSAVTVGHYGAKNFLLRDGKEVVQCAFYENEQALPRLIRGQVHRCVGNYDRSRDVLMCVSVRAALPSELRNAQEAVKVCDAEMRALAKSLSEV